VLPFIHRTGKSGLFYILECEKDNRMPCEMLFKLLCFPYGKAVKEPSVPLDFFFCIVPLEKIAEHGEVQGLAETAGTGDEEYLRSRIQCLGYEKGLVNKKEIPLPDYPEIAYAYAYLLSVVAVHGHASGISEPCSLWIKE
jgi:hypothetical protein